MSKRLKILLSIIFAIAFIPLVRALIDIQKINNYRRCYSINSAAIATGKFDKSLNIHKECKYHLE